MGEFRKRILSPLLPPVVALAFIAVMVFSFSRILLAVSKVNSIFLALIMAATILGVASVLAAVARVRAVQRAVLLLAGLSLIGGGAAGASLGIRATEKHEVSVPISAKDIAFSVTQLTFPADTEVTLVFTNNDAGTPHNVAIYKDETFADAIANPPPFPGVATQSATIAPLAAGTYAFKCDIHPVMKGTLIVGAGGATGAPAAALSPATPAPGASPEASAPGEPPASEPPAPANGSALTSATITAQQYAFNFEGVQGPLKANAAVTIAFENKDADRHNIAIFLAGHEGQPVFRGEIISGPKTTQYAFTSPPPGEYHFHCDVHPGMTGKITFQ